MIELGDGRHLGW